MKFTTPKKTIFLIIFISIFILTTQITGFAKDEWIMVRSENFQMVGNAKENDLRRVALKLEQFRYAFTQLFPTLNFTSSIPTNVVVFKNEKAFKNFKPVDEGKRRDWVAGYFQPGEDVNYIVLSTEGEKEQTYRTIFHEYTHFLINNNLGKSNIPPWVNEGYAEYFENMLIEKDKEVTLGGLNGNHLRLLSQTKLIPLETFFNIDYYSLNRQSNDGVGIFYAQAWALMHYFWHSGDGNGRRAELNKFLNYILGGNDPKASFEKAFKTDYQTIEKELKNYVRQRSFNTLIFSSKSALEFETKIDVLPLDESEANAYQGDLLYHSDRFNDASVYLEEAIRLNPKSSMANTTLGLVRMRQKKFSDAKMYLEKALEIDPQNYSVRYNYAYILSREGMDENGYVSNFEKNTHEKIRENLRLAIQYNPTFAESYNLFAFISIVQNTDIDEAIAMLEKARKLAPGNQWYQMRMSELYLRKEDFENARRIAKAVYDSASDQQLRSYAQNTLKNIDTFSEQLSRINSDSRSSRTIIIEGNKSLSKEELEALQKKLINESINEVLRKPLAGEARLTGFITKIECKQKGIFFTVKNGDELIQLTSKTFEELNLAAYNVALDGEQFSCESAYPNNLAVISFVPFKDTQSASRGNIVSIEMVPNNFKLIN